MEIAIATSSGPVDQPVDDASPRLLSGVSVLVVDDHEDALDILVAVLAFHGALVIAARNPIEALERVKLVRPDVIVSDLAMPDMTGVQFLQQVHALPSQMGAPTPALALTAFVQDEHRRQALEHGFQAFLPKPMNPTLLVREIARLAGKAG
jgi:CheY-like chemotaxis protein